MITLDPNKLALAPGDILVAKHPDPLDAPDIFVVLRKSRGGQKYWVMSLMFFLDSFPARSGAFVLSSVREFYAIYRDGRNVTQEVLRNAGY